MQNKITKNQFGFCQAFEVEIYITNWPAFWVNKIYI